MSLWWYDCRASGGFNLLRFFFIPPLPFLSPLSSLDPHPSNPRRNPLAPHQYSMPLNCFLTRILFLSLSFSFPASPRQFYFLTRFRNRHSVKHNPLTVFLTRQAKIWRLIYPDREETFLFMLTRLEYIYIRGITSWCLNIARLFVWIMSFYFFFWWN